jgi:formyl-CoA transferase/succinate--hydroxymethylglutarate CoA-transferase
VGNPMADVFETKQGNLLLMPAVEAQCAKIWPVIGRPELIEDPRFTTLYARIANDSACAGALKEGLVRESAKTWEDRFSAAGVAACAILTLPEVLEDAQLAHRSAIRSMPCPMATEICSIRTRRLKLPVRKPAPTTRRPWLALTLM